MNVFELAPWLEIPEIRPYVFLRKENRFAHPGSRHACDWFKTEPIYKDPLKMEEVTFADAILNMEGKAFKKAGMTMPRWVFYDCAIIPGFVGGFAMKVKDLPTGLKKQLDFPEDLEWAPISLFIMIPTLRQGEWVAHNLCTVNSLISRPEQFYALGFLTKAFSLWYANVESLCGMTQWKSPAIRLHSHYGPFEILTSYTPIHSHPTTLTYRSRIDVSYWEAFFKKGEDLNIPGYDYRGFDVDPADEESLKDFQLKIERGEGPFYFNPGEIRTQPLDHPLKVYGIS